MCYSCACVKELTPVETCSQYPVMLGITYCCAQLYWGKQSRFPTWGGGVGGECNGKSLETSWIHFDGNIYGRC